MRRSATRKCSISRKSSGKKTAPLTQGVLCQPRSRHFSHSPRFWPANCVTGRCWRPLLELLEVQSNYPVGPDDGVTLISCQFDGVRGCFFFPSFYSTFESGFQHASQRILSFHVTYVHRMSVHGIDDSRHTARHRTDFAGGGGGAEAFEVHGGSACQAARGARELEHSSNLPTLGSEQQARRCLELAPGSGGWRKCNKLAGFTPQLLRRCTYGGRSLPGEE